MSVNLHSKYAPQLEKLFALESLIRGKVSDRFSFVGQRTVKVQNIVTVAPVDYDRTAALGSALGTVGELQDAVQELTMSQDKGFVLKVEKGNNVDQDNIKKSGEIIQAQMEEQITPMTDKYAIKRMAELGGKSVVLGAASSKSNIIASITAARTWFTNKKVPYANRYILLNATDYALVLQSSEFIAADTGDGKIVENGVVGKVAGFNIVETPDDFFPTSVEFVCFHKDAVTMPFKINSVELIENGIPGFDGMVLQGHYYYDVFILGQKANAVYVAITNGASIKCSAVTATQGAVNKAEYTLASTAGSTIYYTLDGTDPRYSASALSVATGAVITLTAAGTVKFVARKTDLIQSDVLTQVCPITSN